MRAIKAMHAVHRSILVPYTCAQMFGLVRDIERYPRFLPWCSRGTVLAQHPGDTIEARVDIAFLGVHSHFTTRNVQREPHSIQLELVDGPFRDLRGEWTFQPLGADACKVTLTLEYRFATGLLGAIVAPVFEHIANSLVDAFAARAHALYGPGPNGRHAAA